MMCGPGHRRGKAWLPADARDLLTRQHAGHGRAPLGAARHALWHDSALPRTPAPLPVCHIMAWHWAGMALAQHGMALSRHGTGMALARAAPLPVCCSHPVGRRSPMTAVAVQPSAVGEVVPGAAGYCAAPERCAVAWLQQCPIGLRHLRPAGLTPAVK